MAQPPDRRAYDECGNSAPKASDLMMVGSPNARSNCRGGFYASPPEAIDALCDVERFIGSIWESACGDGAISTRSSHHLLGGCPMLADWPIQRAPGR
jgi:hypothetical protein